MASLLHNGGGKNHNNHSINHHNNHHHIKKAPETIVGEVGSPKRNILRKGKPTKYRKDDASGKMIEEILDPFVDEVILDKNDPNYDSEADDEGIVLTPTFLREGDELGSVGKAKLTLTKYKKIVEPLITEFFVHGDFDELISSVTELGCVEYGYELVKRAVNMSFDKGDRERELVSKLLTYAHPESLSTSIIGKGFERLFEIIDEIEKDAPIAREMLSKFLARAVLDEVLPPSFLNDPIVCNLGGEVVEATKRMLSREHAGSRLESCWGPGDGRPVEELKVAVDLLLQEFLLSGDMTEATRCIQELQAPHFYHEIVKRAVVQALDKSIEKQQVMSDFLTHLKEQGYLKLTQATLGFNHLYDVLDDLSLDTPSAGKILLEFTKRAIHDSVLPKTYSRFQVIDNLNNIKPVSISVPVPVAVDVAQ